MNKYCDVNCCNIIQNGDDLKCTYYFESKKEEIKKNKLLYLGKGRFKNYTDKEISKIKKGKILEFSDSDKKFIKRDRCLKIAKG